METICLSASLKFMDIIRTTILKFEEIGIRAFFPNLDAGFDKDNLDMGAMKHLIQDHFQAIDSAEALYVIDPEGYIGTLVKVEIGYAWGKRKPVYFTEKANSPDLDSLSKGVIALDSIKLFCDL